LQPWPQVPQFARSVVRSRQTPPQFASPLPHDVWHMPALQICPAAHAMPQPPQFSRSLVRSRQTPPQFISAALHVTTHAPVEHT
jgi:hypothetical protein